MASTWPNPSGAYRNAAWTTSGATASQIVLDTVDSSYPYTVLSSGSIIINRPGLVTVTAQGGVTGFAMTIQLRINGTTVATGNNGTTSSLTYSYVAKTSDSIALWETDSVSGTTGTTGAANTFVHVTPGGTRTPPYNAMVVVNRAALY